MGQVRPALVQVFGTHISEKGRGALFKMNCFFRYILIITYLVSWFEGKFP